jgi:hypothetical protein
MRSRSYLEAVIFCFLAATASEAAADDSVQQHKLDLQERCAVLAKKEFLADGYKENRQDGDDHY